jgi:rubrerythrin
MDIYDFAMKMEQDGEAYYKKMAAQAGNEVIKSILLDLAQDEVKHYHIFKRLKEGDMSAGGEITTSATKVFKNAKNVFQRLAAQKNQLNFAGDVVNAWREAQKIEKKSEDYYREKADEAGNDKIKETLLLVAAEEHKHWTMIEHVIGFLERPKQWLEDAEWNNFETY